MMTLLSGVAPQASVTALHTSQAYSGSVPVKLSGEYSSMISPGKFRGSLLDHKGTVHSQLLYLLLAHMEDHISLESGGGIVDMDYSSGYPLYGLKGSVYKVSPGP